jgi:hypothetical protein
VSFRSAVYGLEYRDLSRTGRAPRGTNETEKLIEGTAILVFWLFGMIQVATVLARYIGSAFGSIAAIVFAVYVGAKVLGDRT